jgi:hypothetical protein
MEFAQAKAFLGEGKAVTSERFRSGEKSKAAARLEAMKRKPDKPVFGELTDEAHGAPERSAQYRACR